MALKINKDSRAEKKYMFFNSDEEFTDFCFAPFATVKLSDKGTPVGTQWDYSSKYKQCIEADVHFVIRDINSQVFKHKSVEKRLPLVLEGNPQYEETVLAQLKVSNLDNYAPFLFREKAERKHNLKETLKSIILGGVDADLRLKESGLSKADIKPLADEGVLDAQLVLLLGLVSEDFEIFTEEFEDENTHNMVPVERRRWLEDKMFEEDPGEIEELSEKIVSLLSEQSDETIGIWNAAFAQRNPIYPAIVKDRARRGDKDAIEELEFLNRSFLENPQELAEDFNPEEAYILIVGHPLYLDQIESMIEDLMKDHGTPDNEAGSFINLMFVFKALGFDWVDNTGNLMSTWRRAESALSVELECNPHVAEALVEAFQKAYPKLEVELCE